MDWLSDILFRNLTEMTGLVLAPATLRLGTWLTVTALSLWLGAAAASLTLAPASTATLAGAGVAILPLAVCITVTAVKMARLEGNSVRTKLRIGLQSNLQECSCHKLLRSCPFRRYS